MDGRYFKAFEEASREVGSYCKQQLIEPKEVRLRFNVALTDLQNHLESIRIKMPSPKYTYNQKDKSTWKYIDIVIHGSKETKRHGGWVLNPGFKHK